jgi:hypothetical protein
LQIRKCQHAGQVGVIHENLTAEAIDFVAQIVPLGVLATAYWRNAVSTSAASALASLAKALSCRISFAISASWRRQVTANRFEGTRKGKMQASSEVRKPEAMSPTGLTGLPKPASSSVSVGVGAAR